MKRLTLILSILFFTTLGVFAQLEDPVSWSYSAKKTGPNEATVYIRANIEEGWHLYSQNIKPGGPNKTTFTYPNSKEYTLVGKTMEPKPITKFEKIFNMEVTYFDNQVIFQQKVKLNKAMANFKGKVEFQVCDATRCLPPTEVEFTIPIK